MKKYKQQIEDSEFNDISNKAKTAVTKLKEKFKELREEAKEDCKPIVEENLRSDFGLSSLKSKWLNYHEEFNLKFELLEQTKKRLKRELYEYYTFDCDLKLSTKEELTLFIDSDKRYIHQNQLCNMVKSILEYCTNTIKILDQKQWEMKNFVDYIKFIEGNQ